MEKYERLKQMKPTVFKRLVGVKVETFEEMLEAYSEYETDKKKLGGRPSKLSLSTRLLMMLEYYREYRTLGHMSLEYQVSEPTVWRIITDAEKALIQSGKFSLPGKKALYEDRGIELEYVVIDATECSVQRPKKGSIDVTVERKRDIR